MAWYALEEIDEAIDETKELIWPPDFWTWTKLALIVFFVGGGGFNLPSNLPSNAGMDTGGGSQDFDFDSTTVPETSAGVQSFDSLTSSMSSTGLGVSGTVILLAVSLVLVIALVFSYLSSVFEFVFYKSLIDKKVRIRKNFVENTWKGARYFGFRLVFTLLLLFLVGLMVASVMVVGPIALLLLLILLPVFLVLSIISGLTHDFVLLRMLEEDETLIGAWKSFWPELKGQWRQIIVYLIVKFFLGMVIAVASAVILILVAVILAVPVIVVAFALGLESVLLLITAGIAALLLVVLIFYVAVPFRTYLYYYVILVYHDLTS